jgi:glycosyltransferase involved in cell wall biosynthesis
MIFFVYVTESDGDISKNLGAADYSYFFVMKTFVPVLQRIGEVIFVKKINKLNRRYAALKAKGQSAILLSFTPPHKTPTKLDCPTLPVFAWEYSTIPSEAWANDWRHNWVQVLSGVKAAITHSRFALNAVQEALTENYPIVSLPAPLWDQFATMYRANAAPAHATWTLPVNGVVLDSQQLGLQKTHAVETPAFTAEHRQISLAGIIYTAVFNPNDGRKNWADMLSAFCFAFRDRSDVTLLMKLAFFDSEIACAMVWNEMKKNAPFQCRVVAVQGYLEADAYRNLVMNTTYIVNSSYGEGQCLPLMEFMSAGKPAIAPDHSGMADYITADNAFVIRSSREWTHWPHDPRLVLRAFRYRIDWESLRDAFIESFAVASSQPEKYAAMAVESNRTLERHCSRNVIEQGLKKFLQRLGFEPALPLPLLGWRGALANLIARCKRKVEGEI